MSNILLVNDNVQDYQTIINACRDDTYAITYNEKSDTYDSIFAKYENIVIENNIQIVNYLGLVAHGNNNPELVFLEKENKMLISQYLFHNTNGLHKCIIDLSLNLTQEEFDTKETYTHKDILYIFKDISGNLLREFYNILDSDETYQKLDVSSFIEKIYYTITYKISENEYVLIDTSMNTKHGYILNHEMHGYILNNLDTWNEFKEFIKKFNIKHCLDFLGCALLQSSDWIYTLDMLETEQHLYLNIRASDDDTGNLKVGGDWVLESDNVNIKELYFNVESIEKWYSLLRTSTNGYGNGTQVNVPNNNIKFSKLYDSFYPPPGANDSIKLSENLNETKLFDLNWKRDGVSTPPNHEEGNKLSIEEKFKGGTFGPTDQIAVSEGFYSPQAQTIPGWGGMSPGPINAYYRRLVLRVSYSGNFIRSFVSPVGTTGGKIRSISFNVTNPVKDSTSTTTYLPLPEYSVGIRNGSNNGSDNFNADNNEDWTIFREARKYSPVTAGLHTFYIDVTAGSTCFSWTGGTLNFIFVWSNPGSGSTYSRQYTSTGIVRSFLTRNVTNVSASTYYYRTDSHGVNNFSTFVGSIGEADATPVLTLEFTGEEPNAYENGDLSYNTGYWADSGKQFGNLDPKFKTHYRFRTYSSFVSDENYLPNPFVYIKQGLFDLSLTVLPDQSGQRTYSHGKALAGILPTARNSFSLEQVWVINLDEDTYTGAYDGGFSGGVGKTDKAVIYLNPDDDHVMWEIRGQYHIFYYEFNVAAVDLTAIPIPSEEISYWTSYCRENDSIASLSTVGSIEPNSWPDPVTDGDYQYYTFLRGDNGQYNIYAYNKMVAVKMLIIGGGGGGGDRHGGGGGAGGYVSLTHHITGMNSFYIDVGKGGDGGNYEYAPDQAGFIKGAGEEGDDSDVHCSDPYVFPSKGNSALGGGGGGTYDGNPAPGGSGGGGGGNNRPAIAGTPGQGYAGGYGKNPGAGGGGGAGGSGTRANYGLGGSGKSWPFNGTVYAGGGGGCPSKNGRPVNTGGSGGGGNAAWDYGATQGQDGKGGGGGGCRSYNVGSHGADGGDGVIILRLKSNPNAGLQTMV